ncbi:MAG TPA: M17 family peptidase N-terminal domain-containing protein, partial [Candidatus Acidoferrum sp.]
MQIILDTTPFAALEADALVTYVFDESDPIQGRIAELDKLAGGLLGRIGKSGELTGKNLEFTLVHGPAGLKSARLLLVGAGKREQFNPGSLRKVAGATLRYLKSRSVHKVAFLLREADMNENTAQAVTEGVVAADFETDKYKTDKKNDKFIESFTIAGFGDADKAAGEKGIAKGRTIGEAQNFARDLVNEPSNKLTPVILAGKAQAMAKEAGLAVEILDEKKIAELKMGALLSVAQGGPEPPRMIVITYTPANTKPGAPVIGLVGKAVTFD